MHVHSTRMNMNPVNPYSAAAEKAMAAQRAAEGRKKPVKSVAALEDASGSEGDLMISRWISADERQAQGEGRNRAADAGEIRISGKSRLRVRG
ncbi:MAG: hypothetical protein WBQ94_13975 [Terracidiphilus sp.]